MRLVIRRRLIGCGLFAALLFLVNTLASSASEPDAKTYWDVNDIRPGMKGTGQTVMVGTKLEEFGAEVLGVMRGVSPGRDMVLCRLTGCNLEHAGIIQGMSGSPIYIDGKLLGAVAFAWEFAKDPIAGVTPFQQMVQYVRASDKRIAAEAKDPVKGESIRAAVGDVSRPVLIDGVATKSCITKVGAVAGKKIVTIEGLAPQGGLHPVQQAFLDADALQCGYCTPGMILGAVALLRRTPNPSEAEIATGMNGHICRCGTYPRVISAIRSAAGKGGKA